MPLNQKIKGRHGESQTGCEIVPETMHDLLEMTDSRQHRKNGFNDHAFIVLIPLANLQISGIAPFREETMIRPNHRLVFKTGNQRMKVSIMNVGRGATPSGDQAQMVQQEAQFATDDPAPVGKAFFADLLRRTTFSNRV